MKKPIQTEEQVGVLQAPHIAYLWLCLSIAFYYPGSTTVGTELTDRSQPAHARRTLPPSHTCMAEHTLTLRPALGAVEVQGEALGGAIQLSLLWQG